MRRWLRIALRVAAGVLGVLVIGAIGLLLYLRFGDLSSYRGTIERTVSDLLRRELRIRGPFEPEISLTSRIRVEGVTLANPDWAHERDAVRVDRLEGRIRLWPLLAGRVEVEDLAIDGARVVVELHKEHGVNWAFDLGEKKKPKPDAKPVEIPEFSLGTLTLANATFSLRLASGNEIIRAEVTDLTIRSDETGILDLDFTGMYNEHAVQLAGKVGTLNELIRAREVQTELSGTLDEIALEVVGEFSRLARVEGLDARAELSSPGPVTIRPLTGLPLSFPGPFEIDARVVPTAAGNDFELTSTLAGISIDSAGTLDSYTPPRVIEGQVESSGTNLAEALAMFGLESVPALPFRVAGGVRWTGFPITLDEVEVQVGDHLAVVDGILDSPPRMTGSDLRVHVEGPSLADFSAVAKRTLPEGAYRLDADLVRRGSVLEVRTAEARIGRISLSAEGTIGDAPKFEGTSFELLAGGDDLSVISTLVGYDLPARRFRVAGKFDERDDGITLDSVRASLGDHRLEADGVFGLHHGFRGTDLELRMTGPDIGDLASIAGLPDLPHDDYEAGGRLRVRGTGYAIEPLDARIGSIDLHAEGVVGPLPDPTGTDLALRIAGPDLSRVGELAGYSPLPVEAFEVTGNLEAFEEGYLLREVAARVGDLRGTLSGRVGPLPELTGTRVRVAAGGPSAAALGGFVDDLPPLPEVSFSVKGWAEVRPEDYLLEGIAVELDDVRLYADGSLVAGPGVVGGLFELDLAGDSLANLGAMAASTELFEVPELPETAFSVVGVLGLDPAGYRFEGVRARVGQAEARVDGLLSSATDFIGSDLTLSAEGPVLSAIGEWTGVELPAEPFRLAGRVERTSLGGRFHDVRASVGEHRARAEGTLGEPPRFVGTNLDLGISGPSLEFVGALAGRGETFSEVPYEASVHFGGTSTEFSMPSFSLKAGPSDLSGTLQADLRDRPSITGTFMSTHLDFVSMRKQRTKEEVEEARARGIAAIEDAQETDDDPPPVEDSKLLISDEPLAFEFLDKYDLDLKLEVERLTLHAFELTDFKVGLHMQDGGLRISPFQGRGAHGGRGSGGLKLQPIGGAHKLDAWLTVRDGRLALARNVESPEDWPTLDADFRIAGSGASPHEILSGASGRAVVVIGKGLLESSILDLIAADVLLGIFNALNPRKERSKFTQLDCAVLVANLEDGRTRFDPLAVQTETVTLGGDGRINFENEKLDLQWVAKPRKGLGLSASAITNPYIKLGGTLSSPSIQMKPLDAVATTGVAVATAGISILVRGMWDRISSERKVCEIAIRKAEEQVADAAAEEQINPAVLPETR